MKKITQFFLASILASAFFMLPVQGDNIAYAQDCVKIKVDGKVVCVKGKRVKLSNKKGNAFVGGIVGGLAGSVVGNLLTRPNTTTVIVRDRGPDLEPWTPEWYDYCANTYRSFNPRTGYYWTYSGTKRFCR